jgi:hypothetical protein
VCARTEVVRTACGLRIYDAQHQSLRHHILKERPLPEPDAVSGCGRPGVEEASGGGGGSVGLEDEEGADVPPAAPWTKHSLTKKERKPAMDPLTLRPCHSLGDTEAAAALLPVIDGLGPLAGI